MNGVQSEPSSSVSSPAGQPDSQDAHVWSQLIQNVFCCPVACVVLITDVGRVACDFVIILRFRLIIFRILAFDRVEYCKLVRMLLKKNLPPAIIRILLHVYLFHFTKVAWNGTCCSCSSFHVLNGVRQGAILSPVLFCVYFDTLLSYLNAAGMGCHIGSIFVGAPAYADGLVMLVNCERHPLYAANLR